MALHKVYFTTVNELGVASVKLNKLWKTPDLVFDVKCKIRRKLNNRLDKVFQRLEDTCTRWCATFGFDSFDFKPSGPDDYFQAYFSGNHDDKVEILGEEIYYKCKNWGPCHPEYDHPFYVI